MKFLSEEWVAALEAAAHELPASPLAGIDVCVQHVVHTDHLASDHDAVRYWMRIHNGRVTTGMGAAEHADVVVTSDRAGAAALAHDEASAQELFRAGRLRLHGDVSKLVAWSDALKTAGDPFAAVRSHTTL